MGIFDNKISISKQMTDILEQLLRAIEDHGGSEMHLYQLLKDTRESRSALNELAKQIVGNLWSYVQFPVGLQSINFDCSIKEFLAQYPNVALAQNMKFEEYGQPCFEESRPTGRCRYQLVHFTGTRQMLIDDILKSGHEHAGWREFVDFVSRLTPADFNGGRVMAVGSYPLNENTGERATQFVSFPSVSCVPSDNEMEISWEGVKTPDTEHLYVRNVFFLTRKYISSVL